MYIVGYEQEVTSIFLRYQPEGTIDSLIKKDLSTLVDGAGYLSVPRSPPAPQERVAGGPPKAHSEPGLKGGRDPGTGRACDDEKNAKRKVMENVKRA